MTDYPYEDFKEDNINGIYSDQEDQTLLAWIGCSRIISGCLRIPADGISSTSRSAGWVWSGNNRWTGRLHCYRYDPFSLSKCSERINRAYCACERDNYDKLGRTNWLE